MRCGIDLGTTRTVVSGVEASRYPVASFELGADVREWIPGLAIERAGERRYGWEARARLAEADAVIRSVKREIAGRAPDDPVLALPSAPGALDLLCGLASHVVAQLRDASSLRGRDGPIEAMIAVPANATSRQRWTTIEAFRRAGVEVLGLLNEPTAAGIEYAQRHLGAENRRSPKRYVVVYDLGGGTFDASAILLRGRRFEVLASDGLARLGGDDFDELLLALALERAGIVADSLPPPARIRLLEEARSAKESLTAHSRQLAVDLGVALPGARCVALDAARVAQACEPLVAQTLAPLDRVFEALPAHGIDPEDPRQLGAVYVVGGAAAFPAVQRALHARYGKKLQLAALPHAATAIGLAVAADPHAQVFVQETVTRHFGVWREGSGGREKIFDPIFAKDARTENGHTVARRRYRPRHTVGHLRFLECSALAHDGSPAGDLTPWREVLFPYDPSLRDRDDLRSELVPDSAVQSEEIEETYRYATDGAVSVRIENLTHGYGRTYELGRLG